MDSERVHVRHIQGRYPRHGVPLRSENLETSVSREAQVVRVRIDDAENPEAWLEITLEIED